MASSQQTQRTPAVAQPNHPLQQQPQFIPQPYMMPPQMPQQQLLPQQQQQMTPQPPQQLMMPQQQMQYMPYMQYPPQQFFHPQQMMFQQQLQQPQQQMFPQTPNALTSQPVTTPQEQPNVQPKSEPTPMETAQTSSSNYSVDPVEYPLPQETMAKKQPTLPFQAQDKMEDDHPVNTHSTRSREDTDEDGFTLHTNKKRNYRQPRADQPPTPETSSTPASKALSATASDLQGDFHTEADGIRYYEGDAPAVLFSLRRRPEHRRSTQELHASGNILITDDLLNPLLPIPSNNLPKSILNNVDMCRSPYLRDAVLHQNSGLDCDCFSLEIIDTFHRPAVLSDVCIKTSHFSHENFAVAPKSNEFLTRENGSRVFNWCPVSSRHILSCPSPFLVSQRWPSKPYLPAYSVCNSKSASNLYYALYSPSSFRLLSELYLTPPQTWDVSSHAYFGEPNPGDELFFACNTMFGLETLFRTSLVSHPCRPDQVLVFLGTHQKTLVVPSLTMVTKFTLDDYLTLGYTPFHAQGTGKVLCPICIFKVNANCHILELLTRSEFLSHYREKHWNHSIVTGLHSNTQLNTRVYTAHFLYTLCLPHLGSPDHKDTSLSPTCPTLSAKFTVTDSFVLSSFAAKPQNVTDKASSVTEKSKTPSIKIPKKA